MRRLRQAQGRTLWKGLLAALAVVVIVGAAVTATAQQKQKGKPGGGGGGGGNGGGGGETPVLALTGNVNLIAATPHGPYIGVYSFDPAAGTYGLSWRNNPLVRKGRQYYDYFSSSIGDADNDGVDELVGFSHGKLSIYEDGSTGDASYFSDPVSYSGYAFPMEIGDVDGDFFNEVVVNLGNRIAVWECDATPSCSVVWSSPVDDVTPPGGLAIGDANNDGKNDIIVGTRSTGWNAFGSIRVYSHDGSSWSATESAAVFTSESATVRNIVVADVDGDGDNEVVATLSNFGTAANPLQQAWLAVWESTGQGYALVGAQMLGDGSGAGIDAADLDADGRAEIVVGVNDGPASWIDVLGWDENAFTSEGLPNLPLMTGAFVNDVRLGNTDTDPGLELVAAVGLRILIYDDDFTQVYASPEDLEIWELSIQ